MVSPPLAKRPHASVPPTWAQPAEAVSGAVHIKSRSSRGGFAVALLVVGGIALAAGGAVWWRNQRPALVAVPPPPVAPAVAVAPPVAAPAVTTTPASPPPAPPPPAPPPVVVEAPVLQAPVVQAPPTTVTTPAALLGTTLRELPARRKARTLSEQARQKLLSDNARGALPLLERAASTDPTYGEAWRSLGIARAMLGDGAGSRAAYKRYLTVAPDAPDAADVRRMLGD